MSTHIGPPSVQCPIRVTYRLHKVSHVRRRLRASLANACNSLQGQFAKRLLTAVYKGNVACFQSSKRKYFR